MNASAFRLPLIVGVLGAALAAHAVTLSFSGLTGGTDDGPYTVYPSPQTLDGYRLNENEHGFLSIDPTGSDGTYNHTGSRTISAADNTPFTTVTAANGGTFSLTSLDAANALLQSVEPVGTTVVFTGIVATGGAVSRTVTLGANDSVTHLTFTGFTDLSELVIDDSSNAVQFGQYNNLVLTTQPTPEPSALAALGVGAVALLRRRK